jgi:hypothetical protein
VRALKPCDGSTSIAALALLLLMTAVAMGEAFLLQGALSYTARSTRRQEVEFSLQAEAERVVKLLARDPTPGADCIQDPVWEKLRDNVAQGFVVTLQDVSSRLNANWVQKDILQKTALADLLQPGSTAQDLRQRREDKGLSTDLPREYGDLIRKEAIARYFTGYGYANLNTTDEFALRKLYSIRTGDHAGAEVFHTRWQDGVTQKKTLKRGDVKDLLGQDYAELYPFMNVEPTFNVHFIEPLILAELLSLSDLKIQHPALAAQRIIEARDHLELTMGALQGLIGAAGDNRIYQYLGVVTWFWRVIVVRGSAQLHVTVARIPSDDDVSPRFSVLEERYLP